MTQISVTPSPRYTFQRNSLYYFRYTLPHDISKVVGKQGLRYSLKTGYIKQAERKARRLAGTVEEFISNVRQERLIMMKLSEAQIQSLLDQHHIDFTMQVFAAQLRNFRQATIDSSGKS